MKGNTVLLVDDDNELLQIYKKILTRKGFLIRTAENGEEALSIMRTESISVVILDILMPRMDGMEVLRGIKRDWPETEVIMLTAEGSIAGAVEAVKMGAFTYFVKPANIDELIKNIRHAQKLWKMRIENDSLRLQLSEMSVKQEFLGCSAAAERLREKARVVGNSLSAVLITGESGTGKEVLAHMIHRCSNRKDRPFVSLNCAAFNENLVESELFGNEKGAYTGADRQRKGRFELADGGTIFFDEIGNLSLTMQAKLLRVLQEKEFERVGGNKTISSDFRLISATNIDLRKAIEKGTFRLDLYYRINIIPIEIPPLRERKEDIPLLCQYYLEEISKEINKKTEPLGEDVLSALQKYDWPGNVRELRNIIERLVVLVDHRRIMVRDLPEEIRVRNMRNDEGPPEALRDATRYFERDYIVEVMRRNGWNVTRAAKEMNITRKTLYKKLNDYGIKYR